MGHAFSFKQKHEEGLMEEKKHCKCWDQKRICAYIDIGWVGTAEEAESLTREYNLSLATVDTLDARGEWPVYRFSGLRKNIVAMLGAKYGVNDEDFEYLLTQLSRIKICYIDSGLD